MAKKTQPAPKNFEDALRELEQILGEIERGEVGLEESLEKYERGNFLIQHCMGVLNTAEKQIEQSSRAGVTDSLATSKSQDGAPKTTAIPDAPDAQNC
jgi:exodeoxyribonuclease VII small subunit